MGSLVLSALLVVVDEAGLFAIPLVALFLFFLLKGAAYKRRIDLQLHRWKSLIQRYTFRWSRPDSCRGRGGYGPLSQRPY